MKTWKKVKGKVEAVVTRHFLEDGVVEVEDLWTPSEESMLKKRIPNKDQQLLEAIQEVNVYRGMARTLINEHELMMEGGVELKKKLTTLLAKKSVMDHLSLNPHDQALINQSLNGPKEHHDGQELGETSSK